MSTKTWGARKRCVQSHCMVGGASDEETAWNKTVSFPETENDVLRAGHSWASPRRPKKWGMWLAERLHRPGLVLSHIEDGVQLGDLQQVVNFLGQVQQFEFAALVAYGGKGADQLADARAVNISDLAKVEQKLLLALGKQFAHRVPQDHAAFTQRNTAAAIHDGYPINLTSTGLHAH